MAGLLSGIVGQKNSGKKVILISPDFFNLSKKIQSLIEEEGYQVFYFSDRPSKKTISKSLIRLSRNFLRLSVRKYVPSFTVVMLQKPTTSLDK